MSEKTPGTDKSVYSMLKNTHTLGRPQAQGDQGARMTSTRRTMVLFYLGYDWPLEVGAKKTLGLLACQVRISGEAFKAVSSAYESAGLRNA